MIRYAITEAQLHQLVDTKTANWRADAALRTQKFIDAGKYNETSASWSDVKSVFMEVQFNKCVFCERLFESAEFGAIEHDLEHFRPKNAVKTWPTGERANLFSYPMGVASSSGYYWLAYDLGNYAASCKVCNSTLKSNAFPIAGPRGSAEATIEALKSSEKPYLCYPIGRHDDNPEKLIEFVGTAARPAGKSGHKKRRAEVLIEFFRLNDRDLLHYERSVELVLLGRALAKLDGGDATGQLWVDSLTADNRRHAACKRAFVKCWQNHRQLANQLLQKAEELVFEAAPPQET